MKASDADGSRPSLIQIKASAGSGKTYELTERFLELLNACSGTAERGSACRRQSPGGPLDWQSLLAITFTNAAAAEMQDRVVAKLKALALGIPDATRVPMPKARAKAWLGAIIRDRGGLNVSTIDSLLYLLLSMNALAEGLPPDFTPAFTSEEVVLPFLEEILNEAWQGDEALTLLVKRAWKAVVDNSDFAGFIASDGLAKRLVELMPLVVQGRLEGLTPPERLQQDLLPALRQGLHEACRTLLDGDGQDFTLHATFRKLLARLAEPADEAAGQGAGYDAFRYQAADFKSAFLAKDSLAQACTKKSQPPDEADACYQLLKRSARDLAALESMAAQAAACQPLAELASLIELRSRERRLDSGLVPSDAIAPLVERLLREGCAEAMCRFGTTLRHILIDEFQDTSRAQWRAMAPLVEEAVSSKQDGTFTWVGDVKQAIYGFRGGDSLLFDELAEAGAIPASRGVKKKTLDQNWRSRREVIAFNNALFAPLDPMARLDALLSARGLAEAEGPELGQLAAQALEEACGFAEAVLKAPFTDARGACSLQEDCTCGQALDRLPGAPPEERMTSWFARKLAQAYSDARQKPSPRSSGGGRVVVVDFPEAGEDGEAPGQEEGVRRCLGLGHAQGRPWSDFLVLVRRNQDANALARHLSQADIPVVTDNSLLLAQHPLVVQTVALLAFLLAPDNDIAFWTLASGSILGGAEGGVTGAPQAEANPLPDAGPQAAGLAAASPATDDAGADDADRDPDYLLPGEAAVASSLRPSGPELPDAFRQRQDEDLLRLSSAAAGQRESRPLWRVWAEAHPACFREHLAPLMQGMAAMTPYDAVFEWYRRERVFERFPDASPFLKRFLELLYACRASGLRSLAEVLGWWQEHSEDEKVPLPGGMDAVQVMTVHKAKGLERPVVIVPWTSTRAAARADLDVVDYQLATDPGTAVRSLCRPSPALFPSAQARRLRESFEAVNSLYVAFTRAREELYIFTSKPEGAGKTLELLLQQAGELAPAALSLDEAFPPGAEAAAPAQAEVLRAGCQAGGGLRQAGLPSWDLAGAADGGDDGCQDGSQDGLEDGRDGGEDAFAACAAPAGQAGEPDAVLPAPEKQAWPRREDADGFLIPDYDGPVTDPALRYPPSRDVPRRADDAAADEACAAQSGAGPWNPMAWMPRLHVHLDYLDESHPRDPAREQGVFVHACLERLCGLPASARNPELVVDQALEAQPWLAGTAPADGSAASFREQALAELNWFLSLPEACRWLAAGLAEQSLLDARGGGILRMDLLVPGPGGLLDRPVVVDYKHGMAQSPDPEQAALQAALQARHEGQIARYLACLEDAGARRPCGVLCYLTRRQIRVIAADGRARDADPAGLAAMLRALQEGGPHA